MAEVSEGTSGGIACYDTLEFVEKTAARLGELKGLMISGDRIEHIRCLLTGQELDGGR